MYLSDCPKERNIPVLLIVGGIFLIIVIPTLIICVEIQRREIDNNSKDYAERVQSVIVTAGTPLIVTWIIVGKLNSINIILLSLFTQCPML